FVGILVQVQGYDSRRGLVGELKENLPRVGPVLRNGGYYLVANVGLIFLLIVDRNESQAPYWIILFLIIVEALKRNDRLTLRGLMRLIQESGKTLSDIIGIVAGVGLIVGGLTMTGASLSLSRELVSLVGDNILLILIAGAITSFVLGMGMTISA